MEGDPQPLDLAGEADFQLGPLRVSPSTCRVHDGAREQRLEARVMAVLVTLARAAPRTVTREALVEACWGGRIVSDDAIARAIAKLRTLARSRTPPAFSVETVTKVGFRLLTADQSVTAEATAAPGAPVLSWRKWALPAAGLAAAALIAAFALRPPAQQQTFVAVAPFEQRDPGLERLTGLTRDAALGMAASFGMAVFDSNAGGAANAEFALEGSLHRDGDAPVVTLRLKHNASELALWSGTFTGGEDGEPGLADMAAARSIGVLRCVIAQRRYERRRIEPATMSLYFNVCDAAAAGDFERMAGSARALVSATPANATSHALLAQALAGTAAMRRTPAETSVLRAEARREAERALTIDRRQPLAYVALSETVEANAWAEREQLLQRALELDPASPLARGTYVHFLRQVGRWGEALERSEQMNSDGGPAGALSLLALLQASQGDVSGAYETLDRFARIYPSLAPRLRWTILVWWDDVARARRLNPSWGETLPDESVACFDVVLAHIASRSRGSPLPATCGNLPDDWRARLMARQGAVDGALALLDAPETREQRSTIGLFYEEMSAVRADPRFVDLARRKGLLDYWRESGEGPDFCRDESRAPVCAALER